MKVEVITIEGKGYLQVSEITGGIDIVDSAEYDSLLDRIKRLEAQVNEKEEILRQADGIIAQLKNELDISERVHEQGYKMYAKLLETVVEDTRKSVESDMISRIAAIAIFGNLKDYNSPRTKYYLKELSKLPEYVEQDNDIIEGEAVYVESDMKSYLAGVVKGLQDSTSNP